MPASLHLDRSRLAYSRFARFRSAQSLSAGSPFAAPRLWLAVALALLVFGGLSRAEAQQPTPLPATAPVLDCAALAGLDLSPAVGAKTHITSAEKAGRQPAPYCRVLGYVEPAIHFEVRLPLTTWTQRLVQNGCGGLCGMVSVRLEHAEDCYPAQHGELALVSTDMGHSGGNDGAWAEKDAQLRIDFAYRGVHLTTLTAKALIAAFYGQAPKYSYFAGCSDGGREALMEAQRFPNDFNGITAGAAAMNFVVQNTFYHGWNALKNTGPDGAPLLTADDLPILHKAVLEACDALDGLKDGVVSDPLSCHFDPSVVECKAGASNCLTHRQVEAARAIYAGANDGAGHKMVLSGPLPGSELAWAGVYIPAGANGRTMSPMIATGVLRYMAFAHNPDNFALQDLRFTLEAFTATTRLHALYDATDPDLAPFAQAGGKLILWHGLADPHISPLNSIAYYTALQQTMGEKQVDRFARLYLFPGGYHCNGGEGPFAVDLLSPIMAWVEAGTAPFALIAGHDAGSGRNPGGGPPPGAGRPPNAGPPNAGPPEGAGSQGNRPPDVGQGPGAGGPAPKIDRTRPVYPYPLTAKYKGTGSIDDASSFAPGPAKPVSAAQLQWLGSSFYTPHYERWCKATGSDIACEPKP